MILLDWFYYLGKDEVLFVETGARALELQLDISFESKWPKFSSRPQGPGIF